MTERESGNVWDIEVFRYPRGICPEVAIFDFDGTVSLIREGWQPIMYEYFKEEILACPQAPPEEAALELVREFVDKLTGKQTIFQCLHLAEEVKKYGGTPREALTYKAEYLNRLSKKIKGRLESLEKGADPAPHRVPGVKELLCALRDGGVKCYLTSGTDEEDVRREARLLQVDACFDGIYGATDANSTVCAKEQVLKRLLAEDGIKGEGLIGFGDGYVEIELIREAGGYAVAVATEEEKRDSSVNQWKRARLISAGADCVIPDFTDVQRLMDFICGR